jgi:hypothetical protein
LGKLMPHRIGKLRMIPNLRERLKAVKQTRTKDVALRLLLDDFNYEHLGITVKGTQGR